MKRFLSFLLAVVLVLGLFASFPVPETEAAGLKISDDGIAFIKSMEGFSKYPMWDYGHYSVGYGCTPLNNEDLRRWFEEGITEEEADALMRTHLESFESEVNSFAEKWKLSFSQNQFDALVSFSYNLGTSWMNETGNFRSAVLNGAKGNSFLCAIVRYCHADGSILTGLVRRRLCEAAIYLNGVYGSTFPADFSYVYFNPRGGSCADIVAFENSTPLSAKDFPSPVKKGFSFGGWYDAVSGGNLVTELTPAYNGKYLYANWGDTATAPVTTPAENIVTVTVTGDVVNIRAGCGTDYAITRTVVRGDTLEISAVSVWNGANWGQLTSGEWICLTYTNYTTQEDSPEESAPPEETPPVTESVLCKITVTGSSVNIRKGPGTDHDVIAVSQKGQVFSVSAVETVKNVKWGKIIGSGWICLQYTDFSDAMLEPKQEEPSPLPDHSQETEQPVEEPEGNPEEGDTVDESQNPGGDDIPDAPEQEKEQAEEQINPDDDSESPKEEQSSSFSVTVTGSALNVRNTPGTTGTPTGLVYKGDILTIVETQLVGTVTWGKIQDSGWICLTYTSYVQNTTPKTEPDDSSVPGGTEQMPPSGGSAGQTGGDVGTVTASALRIRSGPGVSYAIVGSLSRGAIVTILDVQRINGTEWGKISGGWISLDYVSMQGTSGMEGNDSYVVTGNLVNIRDNPGYSGKVLKTVSAGTVLSISQTAERDGLTWGYAVDFGWICTKYVKKK